MMEALDEMERNNEKKEKKDSQKIYKEKTKNQNKKKIGTSYIRSNSEDTYNNTIEGSDVKMMETHEETERINEETEKANVQKTYKEN